MLCLSVESKSKGEIFQDISTFVDILNHRALQQAEQTAYIFLANGETETARLTYQQLEQKAKALAAQLQLQMSPGERALLLYPSEEEFIIAFFACLYAGVIAVPVYPPRRNQKLSRLQAITKDAQAKLALTTTSLLNTIEEKFSSDPELITVPCLATNNIPDKQAENWQKPNLSLEDIAFLQYTSGSTGMPKGVMVSHKNLLYNEKLIASAFGHTSETIGVGWLPLFHDMGLIGNVLQPVYVGFPCVIMPPEAFIQKPLRWLQAISRYNATSSGGPNFAYELCADKIKPQERENLDLSCWDVAFTGAEPVRAATLEKFANTFADYGFKREAFYPCYGMAETTLFVSGGIKSQSPVIEAVDKLALLENSAVTINSQHPNAQLLVGCGHAWLSEKIVIVNPESLTECRDGEIGEIWVSSDSVAQGYWNRPEQTAETFKAYLADTQVRPFLRTGDLGFLLAGELFITGRLKDLIIVQGRNHYPQDIESTVEKSHPGLRQGCGAVFSVEIAGQERLVVVQEVERSYLRKLDSPAVIEQIIRSVAEEHQLDVYAVVLLKTASIPKTSSGKIQRQACRASFLAGTLNVIGDWSKNPEHKNGFKQLKSDINSLLKQVKSYQVVEEFSEVSQNQIVSDTQEAIEEWLIKKVAEILQIAPEKIDIQQDLASYGLSSLAAVSLSGELEQWLGKSVSPMLVYEYPSIHAVAHYLALNGLSSEALATTSSTVAQKTSSQPQNEPIAIIGIGCRFPQAKSPDAFWQLLRQGGDAITELSSQRWNHQELGNLNPINGGFLDNVYDFDPQFFGISPREAVEMDPQQRLLLEVSWEALENACIAPETLAGSQTGVFVGISSDDHARLLSKDNESIGTYYGTGNAFCVAANRLSYFLDFHGPSLAIDTACSSSLVAVHEACKSLTDGECHLALAAGVNLLLSPQLTINFSKAGMLAADGRCKTFDERANGYVRGEGCGVVILKRLEKAIQDGNRIYAIIRGSAVNQDGHSNGLTAPNKQAQQAVIKKALAKAQVSAKDISYVEAHGTGTSLGDPIELNALKEVLIEDRQLDQPCWIGSVKTNIGHLEAAAGIAALIKVCLALQNREIPPHLHLQKLNPYISLEGTSLSIPTQLQPWKKGKKGRLAGVSSFGFGGTNAHVILEEFVPETLEQEQNKPSLAILTITAKTKSSLRELVSSYHNYLQANPQINLQDFCFSADVGRSHFHHCLAIQTESLTQLQSQLEAIIEGKEAGGILTGELSHQKHQKIAFLFTGQGSQYINMARELYETQPTFRRTLEHCQEILSIYLDKPLLSILYPQEGENSPIDETAYTQPALFAIEYALAQLWKSWGIEPSAVMGHSVGEYVAACIAGVFSLEDGLKLIAYRGRLMQALPSNGKMVAVTADEETVRRAIISYEKQVSIAAINGPSSIVISGDSQTVDAVVANLDTEWVKTKTLQVSHAFHSPLMEPILTEFAKIAREITYSKPNISLISNVTGKIATAEIATPSYWVNHIRQTVEFAAGMNTLASHGYEVYLEIGPQPILIGMGSHCIPEGKGVWLPSLRSRKSDWQQMLQSLAELYVKGTPVNWTGFSKDYSYHRLSLPTYQFSRQLYCHGSILSDCSTTRVESTNGKGHISHNNPQGTQQFELYSSNGNGHLHPLIGKRLHLPLKPIIFESQISQDCPNYIQHHQIQATTIFPATAYLEMALVAGINVFKSDSISLEDVKIEHPLFFEGNQVKDIELILTPQDSQTYTFEIFSLNPVGDSWTLHTLGKIIKVTDITQPSPVNLENLSIDSLESVNVEDYYQQLQQRGMDYGASFQAITDLWQYEGMALGQIQLPESLVNEACNYKLHPVLLDASLQVLGAALSREDSGDAYLPVGLKQYQVYGSVPLHLWSRVKLNQDSSEPSQTITADVDLFDDSGVLLAEIQGLSVKRISSQKLGQVVQKEETENWLYEIVWRPQNRDLNLPLTGAENLGTWLLFTKGDGMGSSLANQLTQLGEYCIIVSVGSHYQKLNPESYTVNPLVTDDFTKLFQESLENKPPLKGIVHLWSCENNSSTDLSLEALQKAQEIGCGSVLSLVQALTQKRGTNLPRLWLVTQGAQTLDPSDTSLAIEQAPLWGLGRTIALEHPELQCVCVDLEASSNPNQSLLLAEILAPDSENQVIYRQEIRHVSRLVRHSAQSLNVENQLGTKPFQVKISNYGILENLTLEPLERRQPGPLEVEIQVYAAGLNFRDVLNALGLLKEYTQQLGISSATEIPFGGECAGKIVAVGEKVSHFKVGDEVIAAMAVGSLSSFVTVNAAFVATKPVNMTFEEAATLPIAFLTAYYGLHHQAKIQAGDRVLIHAAAGGVGQAAVQLAQQVKAEIFATASGSKSQFLKSIGVEQVMNSRTLDFADQILSLTQNKGVDIVFNSLNGEFIPKSLDVLNTKGRFIEIGKIGIWDENQVLQKCPEASYHPFDLLELAEKDPNLITQMLNQLMEHFQQQTLKPLPYKVFPIVQVVEAFRYMAQAKHIGKVVISLPVLEQAQTIRSDSSYLITGGLGALGLKVADWMVSQGAKYLVLTGRSEPNTEAITLIEQWKQAGTEVVIIKADVSKQEDVQKLFQKITASLPVMRGIVHAAGVLDDGLLSQLDWPRFTRVMAPKITGTWNLHCFSWDLPLDFFVCFSSIASLMGSPGQGNYATANAFMDAIAHYRRSLELPGLSINWGPWSEGGMATRLDSYSQDRFATQGLDMISPQQGLQILEELLGQNAGQVAVMPVNWSKFLNSHKGAKPPLFKELASSPEQGDKMPQVKQNTLVCQWQNLNPDSRLDWLINYLKNAVAQIFGLELSQINIEQPLQDIGFDSLMAVELKNRLNTDWEVEIPLVKFIEGVTVTSLALLLNEQILETHQISSDKPSANSQNSLPTHFDHSSELMLKQIDQLSDEDVDALLSSMLSK